MDLPPGRPGLAEPARPGKPFKAPVPSRAADLVHFGFLTKEIIFM
jgi:hypothetical protein